MSLREARLEAAKYALEKSVSNVKVSKLIEQYRKGVVDPTSKVPKQVYGYLNHIEDRFGRQKVIDVERFDLVNFIQQYSQERGARSSDRVRSYLKGESPMAGVTKRVTGYIPKKRKRVLTPAEIRQVWAWRNTEKGWQTSHQVPVAHRFAYR